MTISIPVLVQKVRPTEGATFYRVRPLFFKGHQRQDQREDRAVRLLSYELRKACVEAAKEMRHETLLNWSFHPQMRSREVSLLLNLRKSTLQTSALLIQFESLGRQLVISPDFPGVSFELLPGQSLDQRAREVYTEHLRRLEKEGEPLPGKSEDEEILRGRLDTITLQFEQSQKLPDKDSGSPLAALFRSSEVSGDQELERVGRNLSRLYPGELHEAIGRESDVARLVDWYRNRKINEMPAPMVIVGPSQVGKTTIIHEWIRQLEPGERSQAEVWLLSPQRLISGMSYLGEWEERCLAIFKHAADQNRVLYFDDLIGLFHAGQTRDSNLSVGQVLKLQMEEEKLFVLAEATPEAWRKLREVDRSFADLFNVMHVREPEEMEVMRILVRCLQDLEHRHECVFDPGILPLIMELPRRFVRGRAFPGKSAELLRQMAATHAKDQIGRANVYQFFENKTGIRQSFMDRSSNLETDSVLGFFEERIIGQTNAVHAMVDAIVTSKAQLNDPGRPIASLLFLGPTGVGKTECARALSEYYFGDAERLTRFDMNEFNGWDAVPRLIGTFGGRQGLLTGAVRRKPYGIVLLDEIEKANPDVFDLLLQVLDDGRLTDANGVTTDFCNTIVILTSNLGARDARSRVGFGAVDHEDREVYLNAARQFFRPEFFNRLDRVVAFHELERRHLESIVRNLVNKALRRQGLHQRQLSLALDPEVYDLLCELGFHKDYGARALRRAVEDHLVEPLSLQLSSTTGRRPSFLTAHVQDREIELSLRELSAIGAREESLPRKWAARSALGFARRINPHIQKVNDIMETWRDPDDENLTRLDAHYFQVREEVMHLREARDRLENVAGMARAAQSAGRRAVSGPGRFGRQPNLYQLHLQDTDEFLDSIFQAADPGQYLESLAEEAGELDQITRLVEEIRQQAARLNYLNRPDLVPPDRVLVRFRVSRSDLRSADIEDRFELYQQWVQSYVSFFRETPALSQRVVYWDAEQGQADFVEEQEISQFVGGEDYFLLGEGPGFRKLMEYHQGIELLSFGGQAFEYAGIECFPIRRRESLVKACRRAVASESDLLSRDPRIFRVRHEKGWVLDLRSGLLTQNPSVSLWKFILPMLTVPRELR